MKPCLLLLYLLFISRLAVALYVPVKGTVKDTDGNPVPGVAIQVKGTTQGTVTQPDGTYTLEVPDANATLLFSFIGRSGNLRADHQRSAVCGRSPAAERRHPGGPHHEGSGRNAAGQGVPLPEKLAKGV
ncbi:hypothetical protein DLD77_03250 [Chitinophaga alhagiae]|uniref:Carboxypeptidase-like regulatory domain-containing protein n=1 Tax=Chitinophaga alhagiae TaxID=2203219 RepID=A0ABM6WED4_9BACT|nr:hypothetical protein DLD77_03250 [Chitinophaga alhagiae]